jgi:hypothetical protein
LSSQRLTERQLNIWKGTGGVIGEHNRSVAPRALLIVQVAVDAAVEDAWNHWYDSVHLPAILACPYFETGARYVNEEGGNRQYLTVYQLSSPEAVATEDFARARGWGEFKERVRASTRLYKLTGKSGS